MSIKDELAKKATKKTVKFADTGCSLLNLALTDNINGGFELGTIVTLPGESHAGKTLLALTTLACAANNKDLDDYTLVFDNAEGGNRFDLEEFFGKKLAKRLEAPHPNGECSDLVQDMDIALDRLFESGNPFIYVIDSLDILDEQSDREKRQSMLDGYESGKATTGTFAMGKPKYLTSFYKKVTKRIADTDSLIIILQQAKDKTNSMVPGQKTTSGGTANKFNSSAEIWLKPANKRPITKTVNTKADKVGSFTKVDIKKNRFSGKPRFINMAIYPSLGIHEIRTMYEWLEDYKYITAAVKALGLTKKSKDGMIAEIDNNDLIPQLKEFVQKCWDEREEALTVKVKSRFE